MATHKGELETKWCKTQYNLFQQAEKTNNVRVGSTIDVYRRAGEHEREGYSGTMYYAKTENMMKAEDRLLEYPGDYNKDEWSGAKEKAGFIYVIRGKQY